MLTWDRLAPAAIAEGTLAWTTSPDFGDGCELIVQRDLALKTMQTADVGSERWIWLGRAFVALETRVEGKMRAYCLAATGKPLVKPERPR